jgi:histidyl-tRNA synthetase
MSLSPKTPKRKEQKMTIQPRLGAGLKDYLPSEMIIRQQMFDTIRGVFERFGFSPLDTPGLELDEILTGGDPDFNKMIFRAHLRDGDEGLALRFDLTVALARVVAQYPNDIAKPFKRYQVGKVWRGEKPQAGRFREFVQFDADTVGCAEMTADAEVVALIYETLTALGINNFLIKVNNRKILNGLSEYAGFDPGKTTEVFRLIDKMDRLGWENISGELADKLGFSAEQLALLKTFLDFRGGDQTGTVNGVKELMASSPTALEGAKELEEIVSYVQALEVPSDKWTIDLSVARGLGYYTGPVFETTLTDLPSIGSVFSGGRFDDLVSRFAPVNIPATGASVGVDRLFAAMEKLGLTGAKRSVTQVLVLDFDPFCRKECHKFATLLRQNGLRTEIYMGRERGLRGQLAHAVREEIPVVAIMGSNEKESGTVKIKDMTHREQFDLTWQEAMEKIRQIFRLS